MSAYTKQTDDPMAPSILCGRCAIKLAKKEEPKLSSPWPTQTPHEWLLKQGYRYFLFYGNMCHKCKREC